MSQPICLILLSDKSSGSSAIQRAFAASTKVRTLTWSPHAQLESLFWLKAAALLRMETETLVYSRATYTPESARIALNDLLSKNLTAPFSAGSDEELVFSGWKRLVEENAPIFFEKSPHHLLNPSALSLLKTAIGRIPEIDIRFIGLIRNPMDTMYSHWKRWRVDPEVKQLEWMSAYRNLLELKTEFPEHVMLVRYEDIVSDQRVLAELMVYAGLDDISPSKQGGLHTNAVAKWKQDRWFGFQLDPDVMRLANEYGYNEEECANPRSWVWPIVRFAGSRSQRYMTFRKSLLKRLKSSKRKLRG